MNLFHAISNLLRFDRTNWKVLALCVLAASTFWLFNALNKNYATTVRLPLRFEFDGSRFQAVEPLPSDISINISGSGWRIIRNEYGIKVPDISISLERPADVRKMPAPSLLPVLASQLEGLKLNYVVTDTLYIHIDPIAKRRVRVLIATDRISFRKGYGAIGQLLVMPDTASVTGPASIVAALGDSIVLHPKAESLASTFAKDISWSGPQESLLSILPAHFAVRLPVDRVEQVSITVPLRLPRVPADYSIAGDSIAVIWQVPASQVTTTNQVQARIELPRLTSGETRFVTPLLSGLPDGAVLIHLDSVQISRKPK
ncbi:MAG TPA: hypothetical protein PLX35_03260 [Cyclobacteriaceae bacterium]|nr:hypothetical protein [Cyclobacteriaceae bacterium]